MCSNKHRFKVKNFELLTMLSFSIVIATTSGRSKTLKECLDSIFAGGYPADLFEVIVIDSGIDELGLAVIEEFKKRYQSLRFYSPGWGNVGPAKARNFGIRKAQNEVVAFTDDDCVVPAGWLEKLSGGYQRHPDVAGVGGYLEAPGNLLETNLIAQYEKFREWSQYGIKTYEFISTTRDEAPFETNNISYKREILMGVGGFDDGFSEVGSGEDGDLKEHIIAKGFGILFIPVKVTHLQEYSLRRFLSQQLSRGGGVLLTKRKKGSGVESRAEILLKIILSPLVFCKFLVGDRFSLKFAFLDTLAFTVRQLGKLKYYSV